ncbi:hypothetical protein ACFLT0_01075 [Chloroflexota bacterium]
MMLALSASPLRPVSILLKFWKVVRETTVRCFDAIEWAVDNGIQVTNNSYGSSGDPGEMVYLVVSGELYHTLGLSGEDP